MARGKQIDFLMGSLTDSSGNLLSGGTVEFYASGTSTPLTVYSDLALLTSLGSSITIDSTSQNLVFASGASDVKIVVKDAAGAIVKTHDGLVYEVLAANITGTAPVLLLHNTTEEDTDGGRALLINFRGEQSGGESSFLGQIAVQHSGAADDEKGTMLFKVNDGNDAGTPTTALTISPTGAIVTGTSLSISTSLIVTTTALFNGVATFASNALVTGSIGVDITVPGRRLHVRDTSGNCVRLERTSDTVRAWDFVINSSGTLTIQDATSATNLINLTVGGVIQLLGPVSVGQGTTPTTAMDIVGSTRIPNNFFYSGDETNGTTRNLIGLSSANVLEIGSAATAATVIFKNTGNYGVGVTPTQKFHVGTGNVKIGGHLVILDGETAPSANTGYARIFIDTADGDLKVIFSDGFTRTIAADS